METRVGLEQFVCAEVHVVVRPRPEFFPKDARTSAQGLFNLMILGLGPLAANMVGLSLRSALVPAGEWER